MRAAAQSPVWDSWCAALWEAFAAAQLQALGFRRGRANSCVYARPGRGLRCLVHGDDFVSTGPHKQLEWLRRSLERTILLKRVGVLGLDAAAGDAPEIRVLNRILRVGVEGVLYEADPRHAEILTAMLAAPASSLSTPGTKSPLPKPTAAHDCRNPSVPTGGGNEWGGWTSGLRARVGRHWRAGLARSRRRLRPRCCRPVRAPGSGEGGRAATFSKI